MISLRMRLAALLLVWAGPAFATDPGVASGHYSKDGISVEFSHAIALSMDDAEGLAEHGPQVRVLLSDQDVPIEALYGVAFPPVRSLARQGAVRGLLLEFSPADRNRLSITVLAKPDDPTTSLATISLSSSEGIWRQLTLDASRVSGEDKPDKDLAFTFSAPLYTDPVVADLRGAKAQASEQVRVLIARAEALHRADLPAALALTSRQSGEDLRTMQPAALKELSASIGGLIPQLKGIKRVVVRRASAVALVDKDTWFALIFEDGRWKVAN